MTRSVEIPEEAVEVVAGHFYTMQSKIAWTQIDPHSSVALNYKRWAVEALEAALPYLAPAVPQPVDREAPTREQIKRALCQADGPIATRSADVNAVIMESTYGRYADAVLALLAGEQEQVER